MVSRTESKRKNRYTSQGFLTGYWGTHGGYGGIPAKVIDGPDWCSLNGQTIKVLLILVRQYKGDNNGDLCATESIMNKYEMSSSNTLNRALTELVTRGLIVKTQSGYRGLDGTRKPNLYALAWLPIDTID